MSLRLAALTCLAVAFVWASGTSCRTFSPIEKIFPGAKMEYERFPRLPVYWSFSCDFPPEGKESVVFAVDYWNKALGRNFFVQDKTCTMIPGDPVSHPSTLVFFASRDWKRGADGKPIDDRLGDEHEDMSDESDKEVYVGFYKLIWDSGSSDYLETVARHEIGHALGLGHGGREDCLMYPTIDLKYKEIVKPACADEIAQVIAAYSKE